MSRLGVFFRRCNPFAALNRGLAVLEWKAGCVHVFSRPAEVRTYDRAGAAVVPDVSLVDDGIPHPPQPFTRCFWPWLTLNVDADGSVFPCPETVRREGVIPFGNIHDEPAAGIWNGRAYAATRKYLTGRFSSGEARISAVPCTTCRRYTATAPPARSVVTPSP